MYNYTPPRSERLSRLTGGFTRVRVGLGLLLLVAAALKLAGMGADPVARMGVFSAPQFQFAVVLLEVALAAWLLSGRRPLGAWRVALVVFGIFAIVSFYQGWVGQSSCDCFGRLAVSPWAAFGVDVLILAALLLVRPDPMPHSAADRPLRSGWKPVACGVAGVVALGGAGAGMAHLGFGSVPAALAYLRGERVSVEPRLVDVGTGEPGTSREATVTLTNWTEQPVRLIGGTADCSCTVLHDLPVTIRPSESRSVTVAVRMSGASGIFTRQAAFLIDDAGMRRLEFRLTGRIVSVGRSPG